MMFSIMLSFSLYIANTAARIFIPGDFLYYLLGVKEIEFARALATIFFLFIILLNVLLLAFCWKHNVLNRTGNFYLKIIISVFGIGASPMYFYYLMFLISKFMLNIPL